METTFKTAMFGGFDRQDVVAYIEKTARESGERAAALERERDELAAQREALTQEGETLRGENQSLSERCAALEAALAEKSAEEDRLRGRVEALAGLESEAARLRGVEREYQTYRAHMVDVELEARQRADEIGREAQERAEKLLRETEERCEALRARLRAELHRAAETYGSLRTDFQTLAEHVSGELRKMDVAATQLPLSFDHLREKLEELEREAQ